MNKKIQLIAAGLFLLAPFAPPRAEALDPRWAIKFYQSPHSHFSSGEIHRKELEKSWLEDHDEFSYLIQNGKKQLWVKADWLATDLHLSQQVYSQKNSRPYRVTRIQGSYLLGESEDKKSVDWLSLQDLTPLPEDLGFALTLTSVQMRQLPTWKSDSLMSLPAQSRLKILKMDDTWALVEFESVGKVSGWVDLSNLLTKYDFASFAMTSDQKWLPISYREGSQLVVASGAPGLAQKIPLAKITGLLTKPDLGISLVTDDSRNLLLRQNLKILKVEAEKWSVSRLTGHGNVYWRKKSSAPVSSTRNESTETLDGISTEELLKREITSVSFHPLKPNVGIASSQGIYLTVDGKFWKKLSTFKNQSLAVLIDAQSVLYVGSQRSFDLGKSFAPFLRWESISQLIELKNKRPSNQMRISGLSIPRPGILQMEVETDIGKLKVAARNNTETLSKWDFN